MTLSATDHSKIESKAKVKTRMDELLQEDGALGSQPSEANNIIVPAPKMEVACVYRCTACSPEHFSMDALWVPGRGDIEACLSLFEKYLTPHTKIALEVTEPVLTPSP